VVLLLLVMRLHATAASTTRELAIMVCLLLLKAASFQIKDALQLKSERREIEDIRAQNEKRGGIFNEISQKSVGIFCLHSCLIAFFSRRSYLSYSSHQRREKQKKRLPAEGEIVTCCCCCGGGGCWFQLGGSR
jgi:hypothetical protein